MTRRLGEAITIFSLIFIAASVLFGGMYLGVKATGTLPAWAGNIFTAFAGGILALLGTLFASQINRQLERRRLEHEQAARLVQPYRDFMIELYNLLSRKVYAHKTQNQLLAGKIEVQDEEVNAALRHLPPLASTYLVQKQEFQDQVEDLITDGMVLLQSKVNAQYLQAFEHWSENARAVIKQLNEYENEPYR